MYAGKSSHCPSTSLRVTLWRNVYRTRAERRGLFLSMKSVLLTQTGKNKTDFSPIGAFNIFSVIGSVLLFLLSPRFKNFGSSRNSLNPTLRPNLRPDSDDSLCHVIDSCKIFGLTLGVRSDENKTDLGWF